MAPVYDRDGKLSSVQRIFEDRNREIVKRFLSGSATGDDRHFVIGGSDEHLSGATEGIETICIAEGVATSASIHEATGYPAVVAFSANKLEPVATLARERYPEAKIVICADNDAETEAKGKGNPGIEAATKAAQAVGAFLAIPSTSVGQSMDFNDLAVTKGMDAVKETILDALKSRDLLPKKNQYVPSLPRKSHQPSQASAVSIWEKASSAIDSLVKTYLRSRGLTTEIPPSIRFHASLWHSKNGQWPCMVAQVTHSVTGEPLGIQRTFLAKDRSGKAPVDPPKMALGPIKGGVVRLGPDPDWAKDELLMIGEGIETCFSAIQATGHTAWATLGTSGMGALQLPSEAKNITILADGDEAGEKAAQAIAARWKQEGRKVRIARPPDGKDFNDLLILPTDEAPLRSIRRTIEDAEEVKDVLETVVEKARTDPGYPFEPDVVPHLAALSEKSPAKFVRLRTQLKETKCRVTELDRAIRRYQADTVEAGTTRGSNSEAGQLVRLFEEQIGEENYIVCEDKAYVTIPINDRLETCPVRSIKTERWIRTEAINHKLPEPSTDTMKTVIKTIDAIVHKEGREQPVFIRSGELDGKIYLNLGDDAKRVVEVTKEGWKILDGEDKPPVHFYRPPTMESLPVPERGGSIDLLRKFVNMRTDEDYALLVCWILAAMSPNGPYPILVISGEQGSAKSTVTNFIKWLIDPTTPLAVTLPENEHDLLISAEGTHCLAFDNLSFLPNSMSDAFCRLATGGGMKARKLYTDNEEIVFKSSRPVILNGIENMATRPDLADRAVFLELAPILEDQRRTEKELNADFEKYGPKILGSLLDEGVMGLRRSSEIQLSDKPRMADFAHWATACEMAYWPEGTFLSAYSKNRQRAVEDVVWNDPLATAIGNLMDEYEKWEGTATEFHKNLESITDERIVKSKGWPANGQSLSRRLNRITPSLRQTGIDITSRKSTNGVRSITVVRNRQLPEQGPAFRN